MNAEYRCCSVLHDTSHYVTPSLARQVFVDHWWNDSRRELSLKTLQVKDELQESNRHRVTRGLYEAYWFSRPFSTEKAKPLLKMGIDDCALCYPLLCTVPLVLFWKGLFGSRAHILQAHSPNKLKTVAFLSRFIMHTHTRCMPDTKMVPLDTHNLKAPWQQQRRPNTKELAYRLKTLMSSLCWGTIIIRGGNCSLL